MPWTWLLNPKVIAIIIIIVAVIGVGIKIKAQSVKISFLEKEILIKDNTINNLTSKIQEQNDSIDKWKQEADAQKAKVKEANRKADERMKNLGKSLQEILGTKIPKDKEAIDWANKQLEEILKEW